MPVAAPRLADGIRQALDAGAAGVAVHLVEGQARQAMAAADVVLLASGHTHAGYVDIHDEIAPTALNAIAMVPAAAGSRSISSIGIRSTSASSVLVRPSAW